MLIKHEGLTDEIHPSKEIYYNKFNEEMTYYGINGLFFVFALLLFYKSKLEKKYFN